MTSVKINLTLFLPCLLVVVLFFTLLSGIFVPIYSDEVAIHLSQARVIFDNFKITGLFPQCGPEWLRTPQWFEYPAVFIYSLLRPSSNPFFLRVAGIVWAFVWFVSLWLFCKKITVSRLASFYLWAFLLSICALGPLPYIMILARSEQILILCLSIISLLTLFFPQESRDARPIVFVKWVCFFIVSSVLYYTHPKAVFFAPLMLLALYFFSRKSGFFSRVASMTILLLASVQATMAAKGLAQCLAAPKIAKVLASYTVDISTWRTAPVALLEQMLSNIGTALSRNISRLSFESEYQSAWLPSSTEVSTSVLIQALNQVTQTAMYYFCLFGVILIVLATGWRLYWRGEMKRHLLALCLLSGLVINAALYNQDSWNFYTPGLMVPVLVFAVLLVLPDLFEKFRGGQYIIYVIAAPWYLLAILNMGVLVSTVLPKTFSVAKSGDLIIEGQMLSSPTFLSDKSRFTMDNLIQQCQFPEQGAQGLAVDGVSYGYLDGAHHSISVLYVSIAYGMDIKDLGKFLHGLGSDGLLSRCDYLPAEISDRAFKLNGMCCLPREALVE